MSDFRICLRCADKYLPLRHHDLDKTPSDNPENPVLPWVRGICPICRDVMALYKPLPDKLSLVKDKAHK
jgi:hypothetical protein